MMDAKGRARAKRRRGLMLMALISATRNPSPGVADTTPPSLSSPTDTKTGQTTADLAVTTNENNGTLYTVVTTSSTSPTATQVRNGQDSNGVAATYASSQSISSTGSKTFSATGLTAATAYTAHFMHEDLAGNKSAVVKGDGFTTDSVVSASYAFAGDLGSSAAGHVVSGSFDLGAAAADRFVLIWASNQNGEATDPVVVANGVTLTKLHHTTAAIGNSWYGGLVASGTGSLTCSVTFVSADFEFKLMSVWVLRGLNSTTQKQLVLGASTVADISIAVDAGDFLFTGGYIVSGTPNLSASTQAPAQEGTTASVAQGYTADWTIVSTNAAFNIDWNAGGALVGKSAITFA